MIWLRVTLFTLVVPAQVTITIPYLLARRSGAAWPPGWAWAGAGLLLAAGGLLYAWCAWSFVRGRGTPSPHDPPRELVILGPYRYVRNPMYVAALTVVAAQLVLWRSWRIAMYALLLCVLFQAFIVLYEERKLRRSFGGAFDAYAARVHRWRPTLPK